MRLNDGRAIPAFFTQALKNEPITVFGDGMQTRSFIYVDDEIEGILKLLFSNENEPVNIGNPEEIPVKQIAEEIIKITDSRSRILFKDLPVDDPKVRQPDITKAKEKLGWEPKIDRVDGLKITMKYFKEKIKPS
jgi:dTDP-glucose 4,6-dehydratase